METTIERSYTATERAFLSLLGGDVEYLQRYRRVTGLARKVRSSEYLLTNACNIRCQGCWFFKHDFDKSTDEVTSVDDGRAFAQRERARGITYAIIIGGEPTLIADRVAAFVEVMDYVTISTNGFRQLPPHGVREGPRA